MYIYILHFRSLFLFAIIHSLIKIKEFCSDTDIHVSCIYLFFQYLLQLFPVPNLFSSLETLVDYQYPYLSCMEDMTSFANVLSLPATFVTPWRTLSLTSSKSGALKFILLKPLCDAVFDDDDPSPK